jgi:hypothetical protein
MKYNFCLCLSILGTWTLLPMTLATNVLQKWSKEPCIYFGRYNPLFKRSIKLCVIKFYTYIVKETWHSRLCWSAVGWFCVRVFGCLGCGTGSTENLHQQSQYHSSLHRTPSLTRHHRSGIPVLTAAASGSKSVDAGLMCLLVLLLCFGPTRVVLWGIVNFCFTLVQLSLQAAPEM